jgi:hypothetical protein
MIPSVAQSGIADLFRLSRPVRLAVAAPPAQGLMAHALTAQWLTAQWLTAQWLMAQWLTAQWLMARWHNLTRRPLHKE